jgi:glycosyltransferase involved in cell wall biosynthesis
MVSEWALQFHGWKKRVAWQAFQRKALQTAAGFHVTSDDEAHDVRRVGLKQPVAVIPNGLDLPNALPVRQRTGPPQALFLSRVHEKKGLIPLIRAWAEGEKREARSERREGIRQWQLVIAGPDEGGYRATVEAEVRRLGLERSVSFVGPIEDAQKWQVYVDSDLFILPSLSENFGIVVAEAMAAGLPVVASTGTPWRVLRDQELGWWVEPTAEALADALRHAWFTPTDKLREMGRRASQCARREFSWERVARELMGFYEEVVGC